MIKKSAARFLTSDHRSLKRKTPESGALSGVVLLRLKRLCWFVVVVDRLNSECPQQNRANESEHGAHC